LRIATDLRELSVGRGEPHDLGAWGSIASSSDQFLLFEKLTFFNCGAKAPPPDISSALLMITAALFL
jgi:hypothetical protein